MREILPGRYHLSQLIRFQQAIWGTDPDNFQARIHYSQFMAFSYLRAMEIYDHPTFRMACQQFDLVADHLQMNQSERDRIKYPKRSMTVALPIHCDDGSTRVFTGYRVQHHLTLGPTKGGLRYHPDVTIGEVAALAMWMSWKCALTGLPYGGAQSGIEMDPPKKSMAGVGRLTPRYTHEKNSFFGPHGGRLVPDP